MKVTSKMANSKVMASTTLLISTNSMKESSGSARWKAAAWKHGPMAEDMRVISKRARKTARVPFTGLMGRFTSEAGGMGNNTALAF